MKRFLAVVMFALAAFIVQAGEEQPPDEVIIKAEGPVTIDGALSETFWARAPAVRGDYINSKKGELSADPRLTVKYAWDEQYLYIGYETFDKNLITKGSGVKDGPEKNQREGCEIWDPNIKVDVVEFFISFGDERFFWEIHHNAANQFNDVWCTVTDPAWPVSKTTFARFGIIFNNREHIADEGESTVAFASRLKPKADGTPSTLNSADDLDTGYTAEIRLPWGPLGAPATAMPDPKKKETAWKLENQRVLLLAVVQDGDLKERYHHSAPLRKGDWFHKTVPLWPRYILKKDAPAPEKKPALFNMEDAAPAEFARELIRRVDARESVADLMDAATNQGMALALELGKSIGQKPQRDDAVYDLVAVIARCRRSPGELLRLYDPAAYALFYTNEGARQQELFAPALHAKEWSRLTPEALINAAPRPLLAWLNAQAASEHPEIEKLTRVWKEWGSNIFFKRERQHLREVRAAIKALGGNRVLTADPGTLALLIRFAGETGAADAASLVLSSLRHEDAAVREQACLALQRFGGDKCPPELARLAQTETDAAVCARLAEALGSWPSDADAGKAALALFERSTEGEVHRALLFSCADAAWAERDALLTKAFELSDGSVLGVALQVFAEHPVDELSQRVLALMDVFKTPPAPLIEALGAVRDAKAAPYLVTALQESKNLSIRLKLIFALEQIGGKVAEAALLKELKETATPLFAEQLVALAGRIQLPRAAELLLALAEDKTAPLAVRIQCLWSLGTFRDAAVRARLKRIETQSEQLFATSSDEPGDLDRVAQARLIVKMALVRHGEPGMAEQAARLFQQVPPTAKVSMLMLLAEMKQDHPSIAEGLASPDFAVMLAAVHAAAAAAPKKYLQELLALEQAPFLRAMRDTPIELNEFDEVLEHAIAAAK